MSDTTDPASALPFTLHTAFYFDARTWMHGDVHQLSSICASCCVYVCVCERCCRNQRARL